MKIYRASDIEKASLKEVLEKVLKLHFAIDKLKREVNLDGVPKSPVPVVTVIAEGKDEADLPKVTVKPKVLEPLIPFYADFAKEFYQAYRESVEYEDVKKYVRYYQPFTLEQLENCVPTLQNTKDVFLLLRILEERERADKILHDRIGHPDSNIEREVLKHYTVNLEGRENLWLRAMLLLKDEGFSFFEAKLASDYFVFPRGWATPENPYLFYEGPFLTEKRVTVLKVWNNPQIVEWKQKDAKDTEIKRKVFMEDLRKRREIQAWENKLRRENEAYLTHLIENGYDKDDLVKALEKANYNTRATAVTLEQFDNLSKTVKVKVIRMKVVEDVDLQQKWLDCMASKSGKPTDRGPETPTPFDEAVQLCTFMVFKGTGEQPSEANFERVKKFWEVGYWHTHVDSGDEENE